MRWSKVRNHEQVVKGKKLKPLTICNSSKCLHFSKQGLEKGGQDFRVESVVSLEEKSKYHFSQKSLDCVRLFGWRVQCVASARSHHRPPMTDHTTIFSTISHRSAHEKLCRGLTESFDSCESGSQIPAWLGVIRHWSELQRE